MMLRIPPVSKYQTKFRNKTVCEYSLPIKQMNYIYVELNCLKQIFPKPQYLLLFYGIMLLSLSTIVLNSRD